jgi:mannose-6-phosphate isomerase-like protein (cupin superfamily)
MNKVSMPVGKEVVKRERFVFPSENLKRYQFPTHINDLMIDRAESSFSEVFMVLIKPNEATLLHKHDDTEQVFYIIEGKGVLTLGEQREQFNVKPGDVVRIPLSTLHSIKADSHQTLRYLCVDCFGGRPDDEPTWDDHVKVVCNSNGWDFNQVTNAQ